MVGRRTSKESIFVQEKDKIQKNQIVDTQRLDKNEFDKALEKAMALAIQNKVAENANKGSRIVMVSSREEHERQAATVAVFVHRMTQEFMKMYKITDQKKNYS